MSSVWCRNEISVVILQPYWINIEKIKLLISLVKSSAKYQHPCVKTYQLNNSGIDPCVYVVFMSPQVILIKRTEKLLYYYLWKLMRNK